MLKRCSKCGESKPYSDFYKNKTTSDGFHGHCKLCMSADQSSRIKRHPEINRAQSRTWAERNREKQREIGKKASAKFYKAHKNDPEYIQKMKQYSATSRARRAEYNKAYMERWTKENKELINQYTRNRRARKKKAGGKISLKDWMGLKNFFGNKCLGCLRTDVKLCLDHVVPLVLGGENKITNAQPLCTSCNSKKRAKIIDYRNGLIFTGA